MTHHVDARWDDITDTALWRCECGAGCVGFPELEDAYTDALNHADEASR